MAGLSELLAEASLGPPASEASLADAERELGRSLPAEYRSLLGRYNGVDGRVGEGWLVLHPVERLVEVQALYGTLDHLSGWLIIGTDGGGEAFVLDDDGEVLAAPWIGDREDARPQGSVAQFVERVHNGKLFQ